jgi:hypothetical protein
VKDLLWYRQGGGRCGTIETSEREYVDIGAAKLKLRCRDGVQTGGREGGRRKGGWKE